MWPPERFQKLDARHFVRLRGARGNEGSAVRDAEVEQQRECSHLERTLVLSASAAERDAIATLQEKILKKYWDARIRRFSSKHGGCTAPTRWEGNAPCCDGNGRKGGMRVTDAFEKLVSEE